MIWNFSSMKERPFEFFLKFARKTLLLLKSCQMRKKLKPQFWWYFWNVLLWVILMEMNVSQVGCFQITGRWICYSIFFRYLIYSAFHETFFTNFMKNLFFLLWVILMEMNVSQVGCFQITGRWICYSILFDISFIVLFTRLFS